MLRAGWWNTCVESQRGPFDLFVCWLFSKIDHAEERKEATCIRSHELFLFVPHLPAKFTEASFYEFSVLLAVDATWFNGATFTSSVSSSELFNSKTQLWSTHSSSQEQLPRNSHQYHRYSLCHPLNQADLSSRKTCCTLEMEWALLDLTVKQLQESLSAYLARWSAQLSELRHALRDHIFRTLEVFHMELNRTLCGALDPRHKVYNCTQISSELFPKFRLMIEQFLIGQGDANLDISIPIDNLIMQLLIDASCQSTRLLADSTMEEFDEEFKRKDAVVKPITASSINTISRCHKYCQARLNFILDSLMTNSEQVLLSESEQFGGPTSQRLSDSRRQFTHMFDSSHDRLLDVSQYKSLYTPELLFAIRLNRILMHSLELVETLIEGLREYNMAQGTCAYKLMRMQYCSLCAGLDLTRPCHELCLTILSGCLKPLSELHLSWKRLTDALKTVTKTFLDKPQLNLIVQLRQVPARLVTYYKHLLKTNAAWLQPQCSGTQKLLDLFESVDPIKSRSSETPSSTDVTTLQNYRELLTQIHRKVHLAVELLGKHF
ncbi:uncharacterized protein DEA37_0013144 [Paragonimus westermani]|uniref:Uncharacterized protein n=1 Tax=Paragonimus westermani TaxID=34504 RepID=A0A5J4P1P6_9TREM|nr:uncharacterized protein DEA37_0013144 [Paragonimus westermani]